MPPEASDRDTRPALIFLHTPKTGGTWRVRNDTLDRFFALTDAQRRAVKPRRRIRTLLKRRDAQ